MLVVAGAGICLSEYFHHIALAGYDHIGDLKIFDDSRHHTRYAAAQAQA